MRATPEELVRQSLIIKMLELGYPAQGMAIEKHLKEFAVFTEHRIPHRRVDIVCFSKGKMKPLLMVECKADDFPSSVVYQVIGYNQVVQASFIAVASSVKILTGWYDAGQRQYRFVERLPSYEQLMSACV